MELLFIVALCGAVLWLITRLLRRSNSGERSRPVPVSLPGFARRELLPYRKKDWLFTRAERAFYDVLEQVAGETYHIYPKVRLVDLVWLPKNTRQRQGHLNRVLSKHVDFVLCDRQHIAPVLVIELDDASHDREDRRERDAFVDEALAAAGLDILHIRVQRTYSPQDLGVQISEALGHGSLLPAPDSLLQPSAGSPALTRSEAPSTQAAHVPALATAAAAGHQITLWREAWCPQCQKSVQPKERDGWRVCATCGERKIQPQVVSL